MTHVLSSALAVPIDPPIERCSVVHLSMDDWQRLSSAFSDHSFTQMLEYATACANRLGAQHESVAVMSEGVPIALAAVRIKRTPLVPGGIAYICGGPLTGRASGDHLVAALIALREEYATRRGLVLRILGPVGTPEWSQAMNAALELVGFEPAVGSRAYHTVLLDISRPLDIIRAAFSQRWRRGLNNAERQNLDTAHGASLSLVDELSELYTPMARRKRFVNDLDMAFYAAVARAMGDDSRFIVHTVRREGRLLSAMLTKSLGDTCVGIINATNEEGREARSAYLLHWNVIRAAHNAGLKWFDLNGIDRANNAGVAWFKDGMGGIDAVAPGPWQCVPRTLSAHMTIGLERCYRKYTQLRSKPSQGSLAPKSKLPDATPEA